MGEKKAVTEPQSSMIMEFGLAPEVRFGIGTSVLVENLHSEGYTTVTAIGEFRAIPQSREEVNMAPYVLASKVTYVNKSSGFIRSIRTGRKVYLNPSQAQS